MFARKQSHLSWEVATDSDNWMQLTRPQDAAMPHKVSNAAKVRRNLRRRRLLGFTLFTLLVGFLVGSYAYRQAGSGLAQIESELETSVAIETWAAQSDAAVVLNERLDPAAPELWRTRVQLTSTRDEATRGDVMPPPQVQPILFRNGVALVEMHDRSSSGAIYVTKRFYRETDDGWVHTTPRPTFWGPLRVRESRYFRFFFSTRDKETVDKVVATIDGMYAVMRSDLGLPEADSTDKLSVHVTVSATPDFDLLNLHFDGNNLNIPSPELLSVRQDISLDKALQLGILQALSRKLYYESEKRFPIRRPWHLLRQTIPDWQISQTAISEQPSTTMLRRLYNDWPASGRTEHSLLSHEVDWICHISSAGMPIVENPLLGDNCGGQTPSRLLAQIPTPPANLQAVDLEPSYGSENEHWVQQWQRSAILTSIVSYGVEKYGRDSLPLLIEGTTTYDDWSTLIPAVYGISIEEFETGWLAHLGLSAEMRD